MVREVLGVLGVLGVLQAQGVPPPPVARDGVITGQVVDGATGKPISAAVVVLAGSAIQDLQRLLTSGDGRFVFTNLVVPGRFSGVATKGGYAEGAPGRNRPGGTTLPIELSAAQKTSDIVIRVWKYGAITGTVTDEAGEPVVGMQVRALVRRPGGPRQFAPAAAGAVTDDRGVYRIGSLLPGDYIVIGSQPGVSAPARIFEDVARTGRGVGELAGLVASMSIQGVRVGDGLYGTGRGSVTPPPPVGTRMQIYPPTFHPSATAPAQAAIVTLTSGEERAAIDVQLSPVTTSRVSGTVMGPSGPASMVTLRLIPAGSDFVAGEALGAVGVSDAAGSFIFPAVVPGSYVMQAEVRESPGMSWLAMPITVGGDDVDGVTAVMRPAIRITARSQFDGSTAAPQPATGRLNALPFLLEREDGSPPPVGSAAAGTVSADGVTIIGYPPGRYRVRVMNSPTGWMFKAAMLGGVDVSMTPFELTRDVPDLVLVFTDRWSGISGAVQGTRASASNVILFPTDAQSWANAGSNPRRLRSARADAQGRFGISSVPPGEYYVVAIPDEQSADWRDPATLEVLARTATQITIQEGEHRTIDLRMREVRQ